MKTLEFPNKKIRAEVIKEYVVKAGYKGVVAFSCGNATKALREVGLRVIDISPNGELIANKWWEPYEIANIFEGYFDATSGHLPLFLMIKIAKEFKKYLGELPDWHYRVPTGSGETIICLKMAYPDKYFFAVYNLNEATKYNKEAPLNFIIDNLFGFIKNGLTWREPKDRRSNIKNVNKSSNRSHNLKKSKKKIDYKPIINVPIRGV